MPTKVCNQVLVERYFLNEIKGEEKSIFRLHLDGCADCRGQLDKLEIERRNYAMQFPFREFLAKPGIAERMDRIHLPGSKGNSKTTIPRWLPGLAGVAICLMVLPILEKRLELARGTNPSEAGSVIAETGSEAMGGIRTKGEAILEFYCKRDGVILPGKVTEDYRAGDELQFVYAADGHAYITLASIDAQGLVSLYRPEGESLKVSLQSKPGHRQTLPFAVTLDNSPGSELFVLVYSPKPLNGEAVDGWLKEAFTRTSGNLESMASTMAPPGSPLSHTVVKSLLLRKSKA
jgi:Putative zinc-finger